MFVTAARRADGRRPTRGTAHERHVLARARSSARDVSIVNQRRRAYSLDIGGHLRRGFVRVRARSGKPMPTFRALIHE